MITIDKNRLSLNLYQEMERQDLSAADMARRTGLNRATIYNAAGGTRSINLRTFLLIANALDDTDYNKLLEGVVRK